MRDIWGLQTRFHYRSGKRAMAVLEHEKFRAGYDFLCIRAQAGEQVSNGDIKQDCQWWTEIQKQNKEQQKNALFGPPAKAPRKKQAKKSTKKKMTSKPENESE